MGKEGSGAAVWARSSSASVSSLKLHPGFPPPVASYYGRCYKGHFGPVTLKKGLTEALLHPEDLGGGESLQGRGSQGQL